MISRNLRFSEGSFFLFGPRLTGKTTLLKQGFAGPSVHYLNLLLGRIANRYLDDPTIFREETVFQLQRENKTIFVIDEIQKVPALLDEVHALLEDFPQIRFVMTGSSARKLKRSGANLLAGRAAKLHLFPLTAGELGERFQIESVLQYGALPKVALENSPSERFEILSAYTETYLKEEIQMESVVRDMRPFTRFLDLAAQSIATVLNYSTLSRECHVSSKTVESYFEILEDTLIGSRLPVWHKSVRKQMTSHPKFYLFDNGVTCSLRSRLRDPLDPALKGHLFEQWLVNEVRAMIHYARSELKPFVWRTKDENEVDLILVKGDEPVIAIEIKSRMPGKKDLDPLRVFHEEYPRCARYVVTLSEPPKERDGIAIMDALSFLERFRAQYLAS